MMIKKIIMKNFEFLYLKNRFSYKDKNLNVKKYHAKTLAEACEKMFSFLTKIEEKTDFLERPWVSDVVVEINRNKRTEFNLFEIDSVLLHFH